MSEEKEKNEARLKAEQFPAGAESAFLSTPPETSQPAAPQPAPNFGPTTIPQDATIISNRMDALVGVTLAQRYELKSFIGQGGMSVVYKAADKMLGKTVAVKLLLPHLVSDPISFQRFQQEARAASSLSHTNIVTIYDFGAGEDNVPYIVMDYLEGTPLNDAIKMLRGLALERSIAIFVQIADALQCAHNNNVLHRDLKPSNVLLIHQNPLVDVVKLVDFGIAKLIPQDGGESLHLTKTGEVFGSPFYMSPEQCRGEKVDARADIYSMGCLMYEVIAGKPPIVGGNLMETLYKQLKEVPPSFSEACPDKKVPEKLEAIVFKSLHKEPSMRHQSMNELASELHQFLDEMEAGWLTNAKLKLELLRLKIAPFVGRERKLLWLLSAAVVVAGLLAVQYLSIYFKDTREPPPRAASAWTVNEIPPKEKSSYGTTVGMMQRNLKAYGLTEGKDSPRYLNCEQFLALAHEENGHFREAAPHRKHIFDSLKETDGEKSDDTLDAQWNYAKTLAKSGDWVAAADVYSDLYPKVAARAELQDPNAMKKSESTTHAMFTHIAEGLANALYASERYGEAVTYYETLLKEFKKFKETRDGQAARRAAILCRLGDCYRLRGLYPQSEKAYEEALKVWKEDNQNSGSLIATTRLLGFVHFQQDHYKRARYLYETALPQMQAELGESNPDVIAALREYSQLMWKKGNYLTSLITDLHVKELQSKRQRTG
jgi:serine/threonine protein kinase